MIQTNDDLIENMIEQCNNFLNRSKSCKTFDCIEMIKDIIVLKRKDRTSDVSD